MNFQMYQTRNIILFSLVSFILPSAARCLELINQCHQFFFRVFVGCRASVSVSVCVSVFVVFFTINKSSSIFVSNFISEIMQKLGHSVYRFDIIILFGYLLYCDQFIQCHRSDVYIAGFFPYGVGKENSETGESVFSSSSFSLVVSLAAIQFIKIGECSVHALFE